MKQNNADLDHKIEINYTTYSLETDEEYSLEKLTEECNKYKASLLENTKEQREIENYEITRFTLRSYAEGGYYGSYNAGFELKFYRTETDNEFKIRKEKLIKTQEAIELRKKADQAKEFTRKLEEKKLANDPEYQQFLKLKDKFKK